jgi:hypothetical protein
MSLPVSENSRVPWPTTTGDGEKVDLVDEVVVEQPPDQDATAVHLQLASRLGLQLADGSGELLKLGDGRRLGRWRTLAAGT